MKDDSNEMCLKKMFPSNMIWNKNNISSFQLAFEMIELWCTFKFRQYGGIEHRAKAIKPQDHGN